MRLAAKAARKAERKPSKRGQALKRKFCLSSAFSTFSKPNGKAAVILPDGILTNATLQGVRDWLMERFQILAVVILPQFAFAHYDAGVKASILFLRKQHENETPEQNEAIFMAQADNMVTTRQGSKDFEAKRLRSCRKVSKSKSNRVISSLMKSNMNGARLIRKRRCGAKSIATSFPTRASSPSFINFKIIQNLFSSKPRRS